MCWRIAFDVMSLNDICNHRLADLQGAPALDPPPAAAAPLKAATGREELPFTAWLLDEEKYWVTVTRAEALFTLKGQITQVELMETFQAAPARWMAEVAEKQHNDLNSVLSHMQI